jgi:ATP-binding cassette subfamily F protein 3
MLVIDDLTIRVAGRLLIDSASARIPDGARVGLIGRNGTGKTTLFKAITGEGATESGSISVGARQRIGRLAQEAPAGPEKLIDIVLSADKERMQLLADAETETDPHRIAEIHTRLADIDAHSAPARAASILFGLGFSQDAQQRPSSEFSGGWRMRVALAALLFSEPDILLLDEPTNYLDLEGTLWLEDHLAHYPKTVVVISHDRDLLDTVVDSILHLDQTKLTFYRGGYSQFERQRRERLILNEKAAKKQETKRKHLEAFIERFKAKATKARQAQSRMKALAKMEPTAASVNDEVREINFPAPERLLSPPIIALEGASVGYEAGKPILQKLNLRIDNDDRIALLGANGNGKSTFTKLITGRLPAMAGKVTLANTLKVAYFAQHQLDELDPNGSPYDHVRRLMPDAPEPKVRARVGQIGFSGDAGNTLVSSLSGGEKARLLLGLATFDAPHLIVLDEPTNHLDIDSRAALIEAINDFPGAVVIVSHDRHLLEATTERLWLVGDGKVTNFEGDLDDYRRLVLSSGNDDAPRKADNAGKDTKAEQRRASASKRAELKPLQKKIKDAEADVTKLTALLEKIDGALADNGIYSREPARAAELSRQRAETVAALASAEEQWLELSGQYESAMAAE